MQVRRRSERRQALREAKQAVRAYARKPSRVNADAVEMAWRKIRQLDSVAQWREVGDQGIPIAAPGCEYPNAGEGSVNGLYSGTPPGNG
jgi:hypothetical protein